MAPRATRDYENNGKEALQRINDLRAFLRQIAAQAGNFFDAALDFRDVRGLSGATKAFSLQPVAVAGNPQFPLAGRICGLSAGSALRRTFFLLSYMAYLTICMVSCSFQTPF